MKINQVIFTHRLRDGDATPAYRLEMLSAE